MEIKAVAYCRVSTPGQVGEDKYGIDAQKEMISNYAKEHNMEIVGWYVDEGVSGANASRPALDQLLSGKESNPPVQYIIVAKTDRLARDVMLYFAFKFRLEQMGLSIISVAEDWSMQDALIGKILETFMALVGEIEKNNIKTRMSSGRAVKAKRGGYAGGQAPYGYKVENGKLIIDEYESAVVRFIYQKKSEGLSTLAVTKEVNDEGFLCRKGTEFAYTTVRHILENERTYRGEYKYGKEGMWVKGEHEPILKNETFIASGIKVD